MKCMGYCEQDREATHEDPKSPPLDEGKCLCKECFLAHIDEAIEEHEEEIESLKQMREKA